MLEGLDLLNFDLAVGARALVSIDGTGPGAFSAQLFQGIVYATSQACFQWRGSMVIFPDEIATWTTDSGEWSIFGWGHLEPPYSFEP